MAVSDNTPYPTNQDNSLGEASQRGLNSSIWSMDQEETTTALGHMKALSFDPESVYTISMDLPSTSADASTEESGDRPYLFTPSSE